MKMIYIAGRRAGLGGDNLLSNALRELGELTVVEQGRELGEDEVLAHLREADVVLVRWGALPIPPALAEDPGRVRYVLNLSGSCRAFIPQEIIDSEIPVTNWGDAPADAIAEGAMALLLAVIKDLRGRAEACSAGQSACAKQLGLPSGSLRGLRLGLYGCGAIGRRFVDLVKPFRADLLVYDPYATEIPESCRRVDSLGQLFGESEAVVVLAGLSDETRGSVSADLLAKMPDHGVVINVARGEIIDQDALFAELKAGRLRAGLDVLSNNDHLPSDHESRAWPNLILTSHDINSAHWPERPPCLSYGDQVALDNLKRFQAGEPLRFVMDAQRYALSS